MAVVASGAAGYFVGVTNHRTTTSTITSISNRIQTTQTTCNIVGQPGDFYLRILSDGTAQPLAGVKVTATNTPALCNGTPAGSQNAQTFTTDGTEWTRLYGYNNAGYSIVASYSGQNYSLSGELRPVSITCATLYLPSGRTNVTIFEMQTVCK